MTEAGSSGLTSRRFEEEDKTELNDSFNRFTGRSRTLAQFEWEWLNTPHGWGSMWLLVSREDGRIVGHHGLIPVVLDYFGTPVLTGKTENTHVHPPFRGKGVYFPFEAKFIQEAKERFGILFTTGGPGAAPIRLKLGYCVVGRYATYFKPLGLGALKGLAQSIPKVGCLNTPAARIVGGLLLLNVMSLRSVLSRKASRDKEVEFKEVARIEDLPGSWDDFWARQRGSLGITMERDSRYLRWRIFDNPHLRYEMLLALKKGDIVGYVVYRSTSGGTGTITDLIAKDSDEKVFHAILDEAVGRLKRQGVSLVSFPTIHSDNFLNRSLRRNGFVDQSGLLRFLPGRSRSDAWPGFMARSLRDEVDQSKMAQPGNWYYTELFLEGIR
jgi:GNAT superfamily N-acetyltransferase